MKCEVYESVWRGEYSICIPILGYSQGNYIPPHLGKYLPHIPPQTESIQTLQLPRCRVLKITVTFTVFEEFKQEGGRSHEQETDTKIARQSGCSRPRLKVTKETGCIFCKTQRKQDTMAEEHKGNRI